jgi:hypothetical protein
VQAFNRIDATGASEKKVVLKVSPQASMFAGNVINVNVKAQLGTSASKKYVAHVLFESGELNLKTGTLLQSLLDLI